MNANKAVPDYEVAVIGAGPGGITAGAKLQAAGINDFVILERAADVGGSWRENTYPGIGVDLPATSYQFDFARNTQWSLLFPKGEEIQAYQQKVCRDLGLYEHLRFGANVEREIWDEQQGFWTLHLAGDEAVTARFVISAVGGYINPKIDPGIAGLDDFQGKVIRPVAWDHEYDYRDKRVAVIGTGASSIQIVPALSPEVARLDVYQRTAQWCAPKPDLKMSRTAQRVLALPGVAAAPDFALSALLGAMAALITYAPLPMAKPIMPAFDGFFRMLYKAYLRVEVDDPEVRKALLPGYGFVAKRPTISNNFVQSFNSQQTHLITTPIERITANGIRTTDGVEREIDLLVLATGYELFSDPETYRPGTVVGRDGLDLAEYYRENGLQAYHSVAIPKLPNRWMLVGPYSWIGSAWHSIVKYSSQHAVRAISEARAREMEVVEVSQEAHDKWHARIVRRGRVISHYLTERNAHINTYLVNSQGDSPYIRPSTPLQSSYWSKHFPLDDYSYTEAPAASGPAPIRRKGSATKTAAIGASA